MSTRAQLQFGYKDKEVFERTAQIYHHWDGYPSEKLLAIKRAIDLAHKQYKESAGMTYRLQTTYPTDLAAFYILANKNEAGNVEIDEHLHGDIEYLYQIFQDEEGVFYVKILTTHQPEGEEYDETKWKNFWDDPSIDKMYVEDEGELDELILRHCKIDEVG